MRYESNLTAKNLSGTNTGDESPSGILDKIKQVDGAGSGLDADTLDGYHASDFAKKVSYSSVVDDNGQDAWYNFFVINDATSSIVSCLLKCYAHTSVSFTVSTGYNGTQPTILVTNHNFNSANADYKYIKGIRLVGDGSPNVICQIKLNAGASVGITGHLTSNTTPNVFSTLNRYTGSGTVLETIEPLRYGVSTTGEFYSHHNKVWHEGNDGHGSNLDADTLDGKHSSEFVAQGDSFTTPKITFDSEYDPTELYVNGVGRLIFNDPVNSGEFEVFTTKDFSPSRLVNKDTPANTIEFIDGNGLQWNTGGRKYFNNRQVSSGTATSYHFQDGTNLINSPYADVYVGNLHTTNIDDMYQYRDNGISINNYMGAVDGSHTDIGGVSGYNFKIEDSHNSYDYIIGCNQVFSGYSEQKELLRLNVEKLVSQVPIEAPSITVPNHPQILYGTGTAPSASGLADGTMYIQYS